MPRWTDDNLIYFDDANEGWALLKNGSTVCICQEATVNKILSGEIPLETIKNPKQKEALEIIIDYMEEYGYGNKSEAKRISDFRSGLARNLKHRVAPPKRSSFTKRTALHKIKQQK